MLGCLRAAGKATCGGQRVYGCRHENGTTLQQTRGMVENEDPAESCYGAYNSFLLELSYTVT